MLTTVSGMPTIVPTFQGSFSLIFKIRVSFIIIHSENKATSNLCSCAPQSTQQARGGVKGLGSWLHFPSVFTVGMGRDRYPILGILKRAPIELRAWGWASDLPWVTRRLSFLVYKRAKLGDQWHLSLSVTKMPLRLWVVILTLLPGLLSLFASPLPWFP